MKKIINILATCVLILMMMFTFVDDVHAAHPKRLVDDANLLEEYEKEELLESLDEISEKINFDIVIVTTNSTDGKSSMDYADDYFDYNGYGMGENYDGALLLVNMEMREWHISTTGYGIKAINDSDIEQIGETVANHLSYGTYADGFELFVELVEREVQEAKDEERLDIGEIILRLVISLIIGGAIAFIPVTVMKKKLDNVDAKKEASDYLRRDKIVMTEQRDMFLFSNIQRRAKPKDSGTRSGGSSIHVGSSGRSHGGGGGRF